MLRRIAITSVLVFSVLILCVNVVVAASFFVVDDGTRRTRPAPTRAPPSLIPTSMSSADNNDESSVITVSFEGQSCTVTVQPGETILSALERQSQHLRRHLHGLPEMPSDCRRGNCLTCAASLVVDEDNENERATNPTNTRPGWVQQKDGLSPSMSKLVASKGYVLTCSSFVEQSGLQLELGENHNLWQEVYASPGRFTTDQAQLAARSAMAKVIRKYDERNLDQWAKETERALKQHDTNE